MFRKTSRARIVATLSDGKTRVAQVVPETSNYADGVPQRINLQDTLNLVAETYEISKNPTDYIFVVARAVSAELPGTPNPNENGDTFTRDELLRFEAKLGRRVYKTFDLKPNQVNHRADNPKTARGLILDSSYNDTNPQDQYVECLLAIDASKDPVYAQGIRSGAIDAFSMGCVAEYTVCSICANKATSKWEFCKHIARNKMRKFEGKLAYEICGGVVFEELSAVDQPADPRALTQEVLAISAGKEELAAESELLALKSRLSKLEGSVMATQTTKTASKTAQAQPMAPQMPPQQPDQIMAGPEDDMLPFAGEMPMAVDEQGPEAMMAQAPPAMDPMAPAPGPAMPAQAQGAPAPMPADPMAQAPMPAQAAPGAPAGPATELGQYKDVLDKEEEQPMSGDELGVMATAARKLSLRFAEKHSTIRVEATKAGNFRVFDERSGRGLFALRPPVRIASRKRASLFCETVLRHIAHYGLSGAMKGLKAIPYPQRSAQVLDHHDDNLTDEVAKSQAPAEKGMDDDKSDQPEKGSSDTAKDMDTDKAEEASAGPSGAIESRVTNMSKAPKASGLDSTKSPDSDKKDEPESPDSDPLKGEEHDHQERIAKLQAFYEKKIAAVKAQMTETASKEKADLESRVEKLAEQRAQKMMARFERCLNLVAERQRLNHEASEMKIAVGDALLTPFDINAEERYPGMDVELMTTIVEKSVGSNLPAYIGSLVNRAKEVYSYDDSFLISAEKDIKRASVVPVQVEADASSGADPSLEGRAIRGSLELKAEPLPALPPDQARLALRAHLSRPTFVQHYEHEQGKLLS